MIVRSHWRALLESTLARRNVLWLQGVRRIGKTTLCRSLDAHEYFDCELPSHRRVLNEPESFLRGVRGRVVIADEVHRLEQPAELLKIAADHFPDVRIIATGSSTLGASARFKDTLTGRKADVWLTPMSDRDCEAFGQTDLTHRCVRGGLPAHFQAPEVPERDFGEWLDAYWAKDIQELFRLERRHSFLRFTELLLANSSGIFEATRYARPCEISRQTVTNYLAVLEATFVAHVVRPFSTHRPTEIVSAPKVYGFDTGFICWQRGWSQLRREDLGQLWEHIVLNELHAELQRRDVHYWRDKAGHEVDFVLPVRGGHPIAIECKRTAEDTDLAGLRAFRRAYPEGRNYLVATDVDRAFVRMVDGHEVRCVGLRDLIEGLRHGEGRSAAAQGQV
jgi:predicted AAA+ superfamily ATPase